MLRSVLQYLLRAEMGLKYRMSRLIFTLLQLDPSSPRLGRQLEHSPVVATLGGVHVQGVRVGEVLLLDRILALILPAADM